MAKTFKDSKTARDQRTKEKAKKVEGKNHREQNLWKRLWNSELLAA